MFMSVLLAYMSVHEMCAWYLQRSEEGIRFPETRLGSGNQTKILGKNNKGSYPESHLPSPHWITLFLNINSTKTLPALEFPFTYSSRIYVAANALCTIQYKKVCHLILCNYKIQKQLYSNHKLKFSFINKATDSTFGIKIPSPPKTTI